MSQSLLDGAGKLEQTLLRSGFLDVVKERRFQLWEYQYYAKSFGNELLEFGHRSAVLRFVLDRDQVFVEIGSSSGPQDLVPLEKVLSGIGVNVDWRDLPGLARAFNDNYDGVLRSISAPNPISGNGKPETGNP